MTASMASYRVVSACLQISYPGSELSRAGICSVGQSTYNEIVGVSQSVGSLRQLSSTVTRVPDGEVEIILRPSATSEKFVPMSGAAADAENGSQPVLFATMAGIPVSTGMRVRTVVVYEWIPQITTGCVIPEAAGNSSQFTLNNVINFLDKTVPHWSVKLLKTASTFAPALLSF